MSEGVEGRGGGRGGERKGARAAGRGAPLASAGGDGGGGAHLIAAAREEEGEDAPNLGGGAGDDDLVGGGGVELQRAPDGGGGEGVAVDEAELPPLEEGEEVLAAAVEPLRLVERAEADVANARLVGFDQRLLDHFVDVRVVLLHARQVEVAGDRQAPRRALGPAVAVALDDGGRERVAAEERPDAEEGVERREPPPPPVLVRRHVRREPRQVHHRRGVEAVAEEDDVGLPRRLGEHVGVQRVRRRVHLARGGEGVSGRGRGASRCGRVFRINGGGAFVRASCGAPCRTCSPTSGRRGRS